MINPFDILESFSTAADEVLRGMKPTPGGDALTYIGSMNAVEALRDALNTFRDWEKCVDWEMDHADDMDNLG